MRISLFLLVLIVGTCKPKKQSALQDDCKSLNEKYIEFSSRQQQDSAMYYLDETIKCDPKSDFFKFEKVKYYVSQERYGNAYDYIDTLLDKGEPSYLAYKGALGIKLEKPESEDLLKTAHEGFRKMSNNKSEKSNSTFYKIGLDNYFFGKDYALEQIVEYKQKLDDTNSELQLMNFLEKEIKTSDKKNVILKLFNIN